MKADAWRTRGIFIDGKNFTAINFVNIGNQVAFIDTIKYVQQSLVVLANTMTHEKREHVKNECKKYGRKSKSKS